MDGILRRARLATMVPPHGASGGTSASGAAEDAAYGLIDCAAVAVRAGRIVWAGPDADLPTSFSDLPERDLDGRLVTPGLVDCHTHLVHAGDRAAEFEMRLNGASYAQVAAAGGGIIATVAATRAADVATLVAQSLPRLDALCAEGVTTVEVKSGYGLDGEAELNMLRAARTLADHRPVRVKASFLGAHAVPPEYKGRADAYIDDVCIPTLRRAHGEGLVDAVDGFCETIAFTTEQIARVFAVARELGLPVKLHAEQLSNTGGARLAADFGALSADHLEYADAGDADALGRAGCVAVLLPGAFYTLREVRKPPVALFRERGVAMALASDCNPGSSPLSSLLLTMNMGCTLFGMTPAETLAGVTRNAAAALGCTDLGQIRPGFLADLAVWNVATPAELSYRMGFNPLHERLFGGMAS